MRSHPPKREDRRPTLKAGSGDWMRHWPRRIDRRSVSKHLQASRRCRLVPGYDRRAWDLRRSSPRRDWIPVVEESMTPRRGLIPILVVAFLWPNANLAGEDSPRTDLGDCGAFALYHLLRLEGHSADLDRLRSSLGGSDSAGHSFLEIREAAPVTWGWHWRPWSYPNSGRPSADRLSCFSRADQKDTSSSSVR